MELVGAGLGEDLDTPKAELVELCAVGVLVDADFSNGGFGRQLPAGKTVNVDLAAARPGGGTGECGEFIGKLIRVVRECVEVFALDRDAIGIGVRVDRDGGRVGTYLDILLLDLDAERGVKQFGHAGGKGSEPGGEHAEAFSLHQDDVAARRDGCNSVGAIRG